jgi:hypothetical protein
MALNIYLLPEKHFMNFYYDYSHILVTCCTCLLGRHWVSVATLEWVKVLETFRKRNLSLTSRGGRKNMYYFKEVKVPQNYSTPWHKIWIA